MKKYTGIPILSNEERLRQTWLELLRDECDYYLSHGRPKGRLHKGSPEEQIAAMKQLWMDYPAKDKPTWLTWEQILEYERDMCAE